MVKYGDQYPSIWLNMAIPHHYGDQYPSIWLNIENPLLKSIYQYIDTFHRDLTIDKLGERIMENTWNISVN